MFLNQQPLSSALYTKHSSFDLYIQTNTHVGVVWENSCRMISLNRQEPSEE